MNFEYIQNLLRAQPFAPFAVHLSNGQVYVVHHPEFATLTKSRIVIVDPEADTINVCSLLHIANIEMLQAAG